MEQKTTANDSDEMRDEKKNIQKMPMKWRSKKSPE